MLEMVSEVTEDIELGEFGVILRPFQDDLGPICKPELNIVAD